MQFEFHSAHSVGQLDKISVSCMRGKLQCISDKFLCTRGRKVTIFHECEPEFLHDLVLKMRAYIFTPGDLICRKGEVAREMFIIADGLLEVIRYLCPLGPAVCLEVLL